MSNSLGEVIKRMAVGVNDANAPTSILFGKVTNNNPIEITTEQKMVLTKEFLILTKNVKDYETYVTVNWETENKVQNINHTHSMSGSISVSEGSITNALTIDETNINTTHNHKISGKKKITIHNALKINDNVILLQQQGRK